jgi:hypothetical protein
MKEINDLIVEVFSLSLYTSILNSSVFEDFVGSSEMSLACKKCSLIE